MSRAKMLTSSEVISRALGQEPGGVPATKDGNCAFCGGEIKTGDLQIPFGVSGAFMDDLSLAARGSDMTCGYCANHLSAEGLRQTGYGAFSVKDGHIPFRKWQEIASALTDPPEAPFVMVYATANNQHMAWRAPVNYSRDLFYVRVGLRDLKIRRHKLGEAVDVCQRVAVAMGRSAEAKGKTLPHPFRNISSDLKDTAHADLTFAMNPKSSKDTDREHLATDPQYQADIAFLKDLTLGETWALRFVLTPGAGEQPA